MLNKKILFLPLLSLIMASCTTGGSNAPSGEDIANIVISDVKTAFLALQAGDNYHISKQMEGATESYFDASYHKNYVYDSKSNTGFLSKDSNIYQFYFDIADQLINKEAFDDIKTLYGQDGVIDNLDVVDTSYIKEGVNEFASQKRTFVMPLLSALGYPADAMYNSLTGPLEISLIDNSELHITVNFQSLDLELGQVPLKDNVIIKGFNQTKIESIEKFIKDGSLYVIDERLLRARKLFQTDNFVQFQYNGNEVYQVDTFNPNYYVTMFSNSAIAAVPQFKMMQFGYLKICEPDKTLNLLKDKDGNPVPLIYDDTFKFQFFGSYEEPGEASITTIPHPHRPGYAAGAFTEVIRDIPKAFHYPKDLALFANLDVMENNSSNSFITKNEEVIANFVNDFNIAETLKEYGGCSKLEMALGLAKEDKDCVIEFKAYVHNGSYMQFTMKNFGQANFEPFENILASIK